jgi:hypothetical protein
MWWGSRSRRPETSGIESQGSENSYGASRRSVRHHLPVLPGHPPPPNAKLGPQVVEKAKQSSPGACRVGQAQRGPPCGMGSCQRPAVGRATLGPPYIRSLCFASRVLRCRAPSSPTLLPEGEGRFQPSPAGCGGAERRVRASAPEAPIEDTTHPDLWPKFSPDKGRTGGVWRRWNSASCAIPPPPVILRGAKRSRRIHCSLPKHTRPFSLHNVRSGFWILRLRAE